MRTLAEINAEIAALQAEKENLDKNIVGKVLFRETREQKEYCIVRKVKHNGDLICYEAISDYEVANHTIICSDRENYSITSLSIMEVCEEWLKTLPCHVSKTKDVINIFTGTKYYCMVTPVEKRIYYFHENRIGIQYVFPGPDFENKYNKCYDPCSFEEFAESTREVFRNIEKEIQK